MNHYFELAGHLTRIIDFLLKFQRETGIRVPEDIIVVNLDGTEESSLQGSLKVPTLSCRLVIL